MAVVIGLGHVGIYVRDLERMVAFYRDTLGMRVTKQNWRAGVVFLSTAPDKADHEIALFRGRPEDADSRVINQILLRADLASRRSRFGSPRSTTSANFSAAWLPKACAAYFALAVVNHVSALGCYYFDPEGNRSEVFWVTGRACWVPIAHSIDIDQSDRAVMAEVDQLWERLRHVGMGEPMANEPAALQLD